MQTLECSADLYDAIYRARGKDYAAEAAVVRAIVHERLGLQDADRARHVRLLDVACGTGEHLRHLCTDFDVAGLDLGHAMIEIARDKLPGVPLSVADMRSTGGSSGWDVVTCLFAAIGYLPAADEVERALRAMAGRLRPGGLLILEPAISPERLGPPSMSTDEVADGDRHIRRTTSAVVEPRRLRVRFDYRVEGLDGSVRAFGEEHPILLLTDRDYARAIAAAGLVRPMVDERRPGFRLVSAVRDA